MMQRRGCSAPFNMYHQNNSLLFQFILTEFMHAYREIQPLPNFSDQAKATFYPIPLPQKRENLLHQMKTSLIKLSGYSTAQMRLFTWNQDNGLLAKMKNYALFLRQNLDPLNPELTVLKKHTEKAWSYSLQCMDLIHTIEQEELRPSSFDHLLGIINKMIACLHRIARSFIRVISYFIEDENVIYFLICHYKEIEQLYGKGFMHKLLKKIYPGGLQEVAFLLKEKYRRRGFENIVSSVDTKLELITST